MTLDGRAVDDAAARAWVGTIVQEILRESGFEADKRVARVRAQGGTEAVLTMIGDIRSGGARRAHYMALLDTQGLDDGEVERTVRHATRGLDGSDGDLRAVLQNVPARAHRSSGVRAALAAGAVSMESDGDRRAVLVPLVEDGEREVVLTALEGARSIRSDGDTRAVLVAAAPSLSRDDAALRAAYFAAARGIDSDGDLTAVLVAAMQRAPASPDLASAVLDAVRAIDSDGDAARVLVTLARRGLVTTPELRERYTAEARRLSDGDQRRAMNALGTRESGAERY
jgi:hypothetical protein